MKELDKIIGMKLNREEINKIYDKAMKEYGPDAQITMVFEESAELQKELCKYLRGKNTKQEIAEEVADVLIVIEQITRYLGIESTVEIYKQGKLKRLREKLNEIKPRKGMKRWISRKSRELFAGRRRRS